MLDPLAAHEDGNDDRFDTNVDAFDMEEDMDLPQPRNSRRNPLQRKLVMRGTLDPSLTQGKYSATVRGSTVDADDSAGLLRLVDEKEMNHAEDQYTFEDDYDDDEHGACADDDYEDIAGLDELDDVDDIMGLLDETQDFEGGQKHKSEADYQEFLVNTRNSRSAAERK